jgi:spore coat protein U-like protein
MFNPVAERSSSGINRRVVRKGFLSALTAAAICASTLSDTQAGTITGAFTVSTTLTGGGCTNISATAMSFGSISVSAQASSTSTVTVNCASGTSYSISAVGADPGCVNGTTFYNLMTSPTNPSVGTVAPAYLLFKDAAHTLPLLTVAGATGCGSGGTAITGTVSGASQSQTIYGLLYGTIPGNTTSAAGTYTDTATVTVTF